MDQVFGDGQTNESTATSNDESDDEDLATGNLYMYIHGYNLPV